MNYFNNVSRKYMLKTHKAYKTVNQIKFLFLCKTQLQQGQQLFQVVDECI